MEILGDEYREAEVFLRVYAASVATCLTQTFEQLPWTVEALLNLARRAALCAVRDLVDAPVQSLQSDPVATLPPSSPKD